MNMFTGPFASKYNADTVGVRPEHMEVNQDKGVWSGTVIYTEVLGADSFIYVNAANGTPIIIREEGKSTSTAGDLMQLFAARHGAPL